MQLQYHRVANSKDIPERRGRKFIVDGTEIAVFKYRGQIYALNNKCLHQGADLADGYIKQGKVYCPMHGWAFDLQSGAFIGNQDIRLPTHTVRIKKSEIYIGLKNK